MIKNYLRCCSIYYLNHRDNLQSIYLEVKYEKSKSRKISDPTHPKGFLRGGECPSHLLF